MKYKTIRYERGEEFVTILEHPPLPHTPAPAPAPLATPAPSVDSPKKNYKPPHPPYKKLADTSVRQLTERIREGKRMTKEWEPVAALMWERGMLGYNDKDGYYL